MLVVEPEGLHRKYRSPPEKVPVIPPPPPPRINSKPLSLKIALSGVTAFQEVFTAKNSLSIFQILLEPK